MLLSGAIYVALTLAFSWTVWPTIKEHNWRQRREAFAKCAVIWFFSTLPIVASIAAAARRDVSLDYLFFDLTGSPFSWSEQLVYSSTFLAPVIYSFVEALKIFSSDNNPSKKRYFKRVFNRYRRVLIPSVLLLLVSMFVFASIKTDADNFRNSLFYSYMSNKSIFIYIGSWIYWYCVVLIENVSSEDYADVSAGETQDFTEAARNRLGEG